MVMWFYITTFITTAHTGDRCYDAMLLTILLTSYPCFHCYLLLLMYNRDFALTEDEESASAPPHQQSTAKGIPAILRLFTRARLKIPRKSHKDIRRNHLHEKYCFKKGFEGDDFSSAVSMHKLKGVQIVKSDKIGWLFQFDRTWSKNFCKYNT